MKHYIIQSGVRRGCLPETSFVIESEYLGNDVIESVASYFEYDELPADIIEMELRDSIVSDDYANIDYGNYGYITIELCDCDNP